MASHKRGAERRPAKGNSPRMNGGTPQRRLAAQKEVDVPRDRAACECVVGGQSRRVEKQMGLEQTC